MKVINTILTRKEERPRYRPEPERQIVRNKRVKTATLQEEKKSRKSLFKLTISGLPGTRFSSFFLQRSGLAVKRSCSKAVFSLPLYLISRNRIAIGKNCKESA